MEIIINIYTCRTFFWHFILLGYTVLLYEPQHSKLKKWTQYQNYGLIL